MAAALLDVDGAPLRQTIYENTYRTEPTEVRRVSRCPHGSQPLLPLSPAAARPPAGGAFQNVQSAGGAARAAQGAAGGAGV